MKAIITKFGLMAGTIIVLIPAIGGLIMGTDPETYRMGEIIGYSTMILSLLTIFMAVNEFKKTQQPAGASFKQVLFIGLGISAIASAMFGLYNVVYATYIEPEFMNNYFNYYIENIKNSGASEEAISQQINKLEQEKAFFMNPMVNFSVMFITVFIVGLVISFVSAFSQSTKKHESNA